MKTITLSINVPTFPKTRAKLASAQVSARLKLAESRRRRHEKAMRKHAAALGYTVLEEPEIFEDDLPANVVAEIAAGGEI